MMYWPSGDQLGASGYWLWSKSVSSSVFVPSALTTGCDLNIVSADEYDVLTQNNINTVMEQVDENY